ncbi:MAG: adenylate/guanylate cyclase domain-containing protein [Candidatus Riflebacteria bacterium]|nr:adenylate/guanylate cyclase domain-containing protein [Candidatus Riflebacteria bacterium]
MTINHENIPNSDKKAFPFVIGIVLFVFLLHLFLNIEANEREKSAVKEKLLANLKILAGESHFSILAKDRLCQSLRGISQIDENSVKLINARLKRDFGDCLKSVFIDSSGEMIASSGFSADEAESLAFLIRYSECVEGNTNSLILKKYWDTQELANLGLFGTVNYFGCITLNRLGVSAVRLHNLPGLLLYGVFKKNPYPDASAFKRAYWGGNTQEYYPRENYGGLGVFVPVSKLTTNWRKKILSRLIRPFQGTFFFGPQKEFEKRFFSDKYLQEAIQPELQKKNASVVQYQRKISGFIKTQKASNEIIFLSRDDSSVNLVKLVSGPVCSGFIFTLFFLSAFRLRFREAVGGYPSLNYKFFFVLIFAIFVPTIGLIFMAMEDGTRVKTLRRNRIFDDMEEKLRGIDRDVAFSVGDLSGRLKEMLNVIDTRKIPVNDQQMQRILKKYRIPFIQKVFATGIDYLNPLMVDFTIRTVADSFEFLLIYLAKHIGIEASRKKDKKIEDADEIIPDLAATLMGREKLYKLFLDQDRFLSFQIFHNTLWTFLHQSPNKLRPNPLFFYIAMDQDKFRRTGFFDEINRDCKSEIPKLLFLETDNFLFHVYPDRVSLLAPLRRILFSISKGNGTQRGIVRLSGKKYYFLTRIISGTPSVGMVLSPVTQFNYFPSVWKIFSTAYPAVVAVFVLLLFQRFYLKPLSELRKGVMEIASGNYEAQVHISSDDEIGFLCEGFNRMAKSLAEKEYLSRFLSDLTLSMISKSEKTHAKRTEAAILVSDIRSFTTITEKYGPQEIAELLNDYFTAMEEAIDAEGGTIDKFIGDAIIAVFLPTLGQEHPAERILKAALGMRKRLSSLNAERLGRNKFTINNGIGVAMGQVLLGIMGRHDGKRDFTVLGPAVNTAIKLEKRSKEATETFVIACPRIWQITSKDHLMKRLSEHDDLPSAWEVLS